MLTYNKNGKILLNKTLNLYEHRDASFIKNKKVSAH